MLHSATTTAASGPFPRPLRDGLEAVVDASRPLASGPLVATVDDLLRLLRDGPDDWLMYLHIVLAHRAHRSTRVDHDLSTAMGILRSGAVVPQWLTAAVHRAFALYNVLRRAAVPRAVHIGHLFFFHLPGDTSLFLKALCMKMISCAFAHERLAHSMSYAFAHDIESCAFAYDYVSYANAHDNLSGWLPDWGAFPSDEMPSVFPNIRGSMCRAAV